MQDEVNSPPASRADPGRCPVVGIGASAGGLEAFSELLNGLSTSTGMAFVLVQHLDPRHESALAELLTRQTEMPLVQAGDGMAVEPNHVYVIPPNMQLGIHGGVLNLTPRPEDRSIWLPIDYFFSTLAKDQQNRAIGVILSGAASDGTLGLKAIKSAGGITFAQDDSARFQSMPHSAIAAGVADLVLPPEGIARELTGMAGNARQIHSDTGDAVQEGPDLHKVLALLRDKAGADFLHYKAPTIRRRLGRRMALRRTENVDAYVASLERDPGELRALLDDLLINVTEFFRDKQAFETLVKIGFPAITKDHKPDDALRVWVPGCSTGEEVYSIAICLAEYIEENDQSWPVQIFGTDLSEHAIEVARAGRYPTGIAEVVSRERLTRYFTKLDNGGYQIARAIREQCVFSRQDVVKDPPLGRMDLISCRNLLIYLEPVLQKRVLSAFLYALQPSGCLFLGSSESLGSLADYFAVQDREHKLFRRNLQRPPPLFEPHRKTTPDPSAPSFRSRSAIELLDLEVDRVLAADYAPSGFLVDADLRVVKLRGNPGPYMTSPSGSGPFEVLRLVHGDLLAPLRTLLEEVKRIGMPSRMNGIRLRQEGEFHEIDLAVRPIAKSDAEQHFLILFEDRPRATHTGPRQEIAEAREEERDLAEALASARSYMQSVIEELRNANEEAQSSNEELQSTNEELQTAKEELQSANEELTTVNDEMVARNVELSQVNNDLINLLSSLHQPIVMLSRDLRIRRFTPASEKVLNLIPSDVGRPISELKPRINGLELEPLLARVIDTLEPLEREVRDKDGHWFSLRINPYRTSDNRIEGAVLELLDIDPLKRAFRVVEQARDYSEAILRTIREPLVVLDHELRVKTVNRPFSETFRISEKEAAGASLFEVGGGQWNLPKVRQLLAAVLSDSAERIQDVEIEHEFAGLGWRTFQLNATRVKGDGSEVLVLMALEDVTGRKRAAEAKYRRLFETSKDGIILIDADSAEILDVNPVITELTGYGREELLGRRFHEAEALRDMQQARDAVQRVRGEEVVRFPDVPLKRKNGVSIDTEIIGNIYDEGERHVIQLNIRDITERKEFDQRLQQAAKLESLGLLAGGVAHDFNNLLTGILGNASLVIEFTPPDDKNQLFLQEIVKAGHRAADLTLQMLAYAGKARYAARAIDLSELVREMITLVGTSIPKSVELELRLAADLPAVEGDPSQIQQLIMNLVINAAESIEEGKAGRVLVTTRREEIDEKQADAFPGWNLNPGNFVTLEVEDTGSGMDESTLAKIFDPFFTTKFTGRGLGLAATLGIVRAHRAGIRVVSTPGLGSTFKVVFPASSSVPAPLRPDPRPAELHGSGLILIVDDEELVRHLTAKTLASHGYQVLTAKDGEEAIEAVRQHAEDLRLVVLDLTMPIIGGEEAAQQIRALRPDLPIILSSGYPQKHTAQPSEPRLLGFIQKPYTAGALLATIKNALSRPD